ncbi:MAG TPA: glycogen/starch synthase [Bryobacteraceae bacterium]|nr:glycogen/starch synthase [Bryobacteraceae bacterium]
MIAPWCPSLRRAESGCPLLNGAVVDSGWQFDLPTGENCRVLRTPADSFMPILYLAVEGRFEGQESPYDVTEDALSQDALVFGLAVEGLLGRLGSPGRLVWGADWETVPALMRLLPRYDTALSIHNTFDRPLDAASVAFGTAYECFRQGSNAHSGPKTVLEVGIEAVDAVTTVNPGFARGLRKERLHREVLADHLQHLLWRVVGVTNGPFSPLSQDALDLRALLRSDFTAGKRRLFGMRSSALDGLPLTVRERAQGKVLVVAMGRRVAQKLHDVLVESVRSLLAAEPGLPLCVVFATTHGDEGSPARLERMRGLEHGHSQNVLCLDGRLPFYAQLMAAADFNCMASLYEPHGGAFESTVIPIARAVDGLAEQICGLAPEGAAHTMNRSWHSADEPPSGFLFREADSDAAELDAHLRELLTQSPSPSNALFDAMVRELSAVLLRAIRLRRDDEDSYARLVRAALEKQNANSWQANLGGVVALVEAARARRALL